MRGVGGGARMGVKFWCWGEREGKVLEMGRGFGSNAMVRVRCWCWGEGEGDVFVVRLG